MKIRPGVAKLFHKDRRTERQRERERERKGGTDMTRLMVVFHDFAKAPKNGKN
jgi:hypothetical protein